MGGMLCETLDVIRRPPWGGGGDPGKKGALPILLVCGRSWGRSRRPVGCKWVRPIHHTPPLQRSPGGLSYQCRVGANR